MNDVREKTIKFYQIVNEAIKLHSNPIDGKISIEYPTPYRCSSVTIHNSISELVYSGMMNTSQLIELNNLPSGIMF